MTESWPACGYDAGHSGHAPVTPPEGRVRERWRHHLGGTFAYHAPVVAAVGRDPVAIVESRMTQVRAPTARAVGPDGDLRWALQVGEEYGRGAVPAVDGDRVVFPEGWVVDAATGGRRLSFDPGRPTDGLPATVADDRLHTGYRAIDLRDAGPGRTVDGAGVAAGPRAVAGSDADGSSADERSRERERELWRHEADKPTFRRIGPDGERVLTTGPGGYPPAGGPALAAGTESSVGDPDGGGDSGTRDPEDSDGADSSAEGAQEDGPGRDRVYVAGRTRDGALRVVDGEVREEYDEWGHLLALDAADGRQR